MRLMKTKGLIIVNTGYGKGKTTAALGIAFRTLGHGLPVCIIQFIKGTWKYGELYSAERFADLLEFHVVGKGFTWKSKDLESDRQTALEGWELAKAKIKEGRHSLVILDEFTYALNFKMVEKEEAIAFLKHKPEEIHVMVTGRDAPPALVEIADLVTDMRELKHPFRSGITAQKGVEF
ncbi:MAG: cob(I)yrinic acid a,c-diamide adenosyltransferase [Deltaproteobacteria bacterium]|nr:cob(I)yrinic acid a,c-diamide adenosyltransferase [Deltaproteobacteria bacterium]